MQSWEKPPVILLSHPQMGENIGAAARAMWNFGLDRMRVVSPRDGWPNERAVALASGAGEIVVTDDRSGERVRREPRGYYECPWRAANEQRLAGWSHDSVLQFLRHTDERKCVGQFHGRPGSRSSSTNTEPVFDYTYK